MEVSYSQASAFCNQPEFKNVHSTYQHKNYPMNKFEISCAVLLYSCQGVNLLFTFYYYVQLQQVKTSTVGGCVLTGDWVLEKLTWA